MKSRTTFGVLATTFWDYLSSWGEDIGDFFASLIHQPGSLWWSFFIGLAWMIVASHNIRSSYRLSGKHEAIVVYLVYVLVWAALFKVMEIGSPWVSILITTCCPVLVFLVKFVWERLVRFRLPKKLSSPTEVPLTQSDGNKSQCEHPIVHVDSLNDSSSDGTQEESEEPRPMRTRESNRIRAEPGFYGRLASMESHRATKGTIVVGRG